jgi:hypothetical protein
MLLAVSLIGIYAYSRLLGARQIEAYL